MAIEFRELTPTDYDSLVELWEHQKVIGDIPCAKNQDAYEYYLAHNACLSLAAIDDEKLVGAILCGKDSNHRMIEHVTLHQDYFNHADPPLVNRLINRAMNKLIKRGYTKCAIQIAEESLIQNFWTSIRWVDQPDLSDLTTVDHIKLQEYEDHEAAMLLQAQTPADKVRSENQVEEQVPASAATSTQSSEQPESQDDKQAA